MQSQALEKYLQALSEENRHVLGGFARKFLEWVGDRELDSNVVRDWIARRRKGGYSDATLLWEWSVIGRLYRVNKLPWPFTRGEAPIVHEQDVWAPSLDPEDIRAMIRVATGVEKHHGAHAPKTQHRAFLALATVYGIRRGEMAGIQPGHLNQASKLLFIETLKHGRQRYHIVPDAIMSHLAEWGFERKVSLPYLSNVFTELKAMIGFTNKDSKEMGWHAIRRSLDHELIEAGLTLPTVEAFMRWKRSTSDMARRYHNAPVVGRKGVARDLAMGDRRVDEQVFAVHPFLGAWSKEKS